MINYFASQDEKRKKQIKKYIGLEIGADIRNMNSTHRNNWKREPRTSDQ